MTTRAAQMLERLRRLLPLRPPSRGWLYARLRIEAQALAGEANSLETQAAHAEAQLRLGHHLVRRGNQAWDTPATTWMFEPRADALEGATGTWLDSWGAIFGVPRNPNETDASFQRRILTEIPRPTTTNIGLGLVIDDALGISGTQVVDAIDWFHPSQYNAGERMNDGLRLAPFGASPLCSFAVILPVSIPSGHSESEVWDIANRRRAAGTRIVSILSDGSQLSINSPRIVLVTRTFQANIVYGEPGASFGWTCDNGTIIAGQNSDTVTVQPIALGNVLLRVTQNSGMGAGKTGHRSVNAIDANTGAIQIAREAPAGEVAQAWVNQQGGNFYTWTVLNGYIVGASNSDRVAIVMGEAEPESGATATISCSVNGGEKSVAQVQILPFPHAYIRTATIQRGVPEWFALDLGKKWLIKRIATDAPCRIRIYASAAQRAADISRQLGEHLGPDHGLIAEVVTTASDLDIGMRPWAFGETPLNMAFVSIENTTPGSATITTTIHTQKNEA